MAHQPKKTTEIYKPAGLLILYLALGLLTLLPALDQAFAHPDVYAALPEDTRVIQYGLGDPDGDSREELAVLYTSGGKVRITLFKAGSGRWYSWWEDGSSLVEKGGTKPHTLEMADLTGDGIDEILIYYMSEDGKALHTRILALSTSESASPAFSIILEDKTAPPGYPLFGSENGSPSVTFLKIPLENGEDGYRRVYCWDGEQFERCVEVLWEKP